MNRTIGYFYIHYLCADSDNIDEIRSYFEASERDISDTQTLGGRKNPSTLDTVLYILRMYGNEDTLKNLEERKIQIQMFHRDLNAQYAKRFERIFASREFDDMKF